MNADRKLLVLGAGFSKHLSELVKLKPTYPTIAEFWDRAREEKELLESQGQTLGGWSDFWRLHDHAVSSGHKLPDIEKTLDMFVLAEQEGEILNWYGEPFEPKVLKDQLIFVLYHTLMGPLARFWAQGSVQDRLYQAVGKLLNVVGVPDAVITFNWDCLLDLALHKRISEGGIPNGPPGPNQMYDLPEFYQIVGEEPLQFEFQLIGLKNYPPNKDCFAFLKLHGSTNWLVCPLCQQVFIFGSYKAAKLAANIDSWEIRCPKDRSRLKLMIVPPNTAKDYSSYHLMCLWKRAYLEVSCASEITIFGYGMRDSDYRATDLFLRGRAKAGKPPRRLILVDPKGNEFADRLSNIFGIRPEVKTTLGGVA